MLQSLSMDDKMSDEHVPAAVWAKLDLIISQLNEVKLSVARVEGDNKLQNQVVAHVAEILREVKKDATKDIEKLDNRITVLETFRNKMLGMAVGASIFSGIITAIVVTFIKSVFEGK